MERIVVSVEGMTCTGCVQSVERALFKVPGVIVARASLNPGQVKIRFNEVETTLASLAEAIRGAGFVVPTGD